MLAKIAMRALKKVAQCSTIAPALKLFE